MTTTAPALSQLIDIFSFYQRYSAVAGKPTNSRNDGKEWHGSCPKCSGHDRFSFWESGRYSCSLRSSGCGIHGSSPYWFLRDVEGLNHRHACDELGIDPDDLPGAATLPALPLFMTKDEPPCKKWQDAAEAFLWRAERYLWTRAPEQLDYLHSRGLTDETIRQARLGSCPGWYSDSLENWGLSSTQTESDKEIKVPEGIVIPWFVGGKPWKLSIRRPEQGYFQVLGSSDALYNIDSSKLDHPVMLFESELDALSAQQEAGDLAAMVATGGASKGISARWIAKFLQASHVFIAFDKDAAGDSGAEEWKRILPDGHVTRWSTWSKDCNQMLQDGEPVRLWVQMATAIDDTARAFLAAVAPPRGRKYTPLAGENIPPSREKIYPPDAPALPWYMMLPTANPIPQFLCKFCKIRRWMWYAEDNEYICLHCYSPANWTQPK